MGQQQMTELTLLQQMDVFSTSRLDTVQQLYMYMYINNNYSVLIINGLSWIISSAAL